LKTANYKTIINAATQATKIIEFINSSAFTLKKEESGCGFIVGVVSDGANNRGFGGKSGGGMAGVAKGAALIVFSHCAHFVSGAAIV